MTIEERLSSEFGLRSDYTKNIIELIDEGNTIPFIARYRKEMHGSCDDQVLRDFADRLKYLRNLADEKEKVQKVITEQGKWTDELAAALEIADLVPEDRLSEDNVMPEAFDPQVAVKVAEAVKACIK